MKTLAESKPSVLVILKARSLSTTQLTLLAGLAVPLVVGVNSRDRCNCSSGC